jgi:hypothetical protein
VELIKLSMEQKDALTVLLTGRSEAGFAELLKKMLASRGLDCDMVVLKPARGPNNQRFSSTMAFKQVFLEFLVETYSAADEIRVYEDRVKHVKGFREFFTNYNRAQNGIGGTPTRGPITAEVVQVSDGVTILDPVVETAEVQRLINDHNEAISKGKKGQRLQIKKTVFYTGYLIEKEDTQKLLTLAQLPPNTPDNDMKFLANNVLITPRPCPGSILEKVGGMGNKLTWTVTGTAVFENKIWAAAVKPVPDTAKYYTENPVPIVVLALRKGARPIDAGKIQNWQPVPQDKQYIFETTVGEKVLLRVEEEDLRENEYESLFPNKTYKRKHLEDDNQPKQHNASFEKRQNGNRGGYQNQNQGYGGRGQGGRGFRGGNSNRGYRGNNRGSGGRGRGRGGGYNYRSLDDVGEKPTAPNYGPGSYQDNFPGLGQQSAFQQYQGGNQQQYQGQGQGQGRGRGGYADDGNLQQYY